MGHPRLQDRTEALVVAIDAAEVASLRDAHADIRDFASECVDEHEPSWEGGVAVKRWCRHARSSLETGSDESPHMLRSTASECFYRRVSSAAISPDRLHSPGEGSSGL